MNFPFGQTRTRVAARHALIASDGRVKSSVPGITGAGVVILINGAMGARFAQLQVTFEVGGSAAVAANEIETAGYIENGGATVTIEAQSQKCGVGGFFFAP